MWLDVPIYVTVFPFYFPFHLDAVLGLESWSLRAGKTLRDLLATTIGCRGAVVDEGQS